MIKIEPNKLKGTVTVPPSKSMAHRAVICAGLATGQSVIRNIQLSDDIIATMEGMRAFGATIEQAGNTLTIDGCGLETARTSQEIDCNESGSTLRFFVPLATLFEGPTHFVGRGKLGQRPLDTYRELFSLQNLRYESGSSENLDLTIEGQLSSGNYEMRGDVSSQFITGMLLTLPLLDGNSTIDITTHLESKGYIDLTLSVLSAFGIIIKHDDDYKTFEIKGNQRYQAQDYTVEGDYSQAAFWLSAQLLGNPVEVDGLDQESLQGDREIVSILEQLHSDEEERIIDGAQVPDIIPTVALAASLSKGKTKLINLERLRIKESDRLVATQKELSALGAHIEIVGDQLHIEGVSSLRGGAEVWSHKDHRMAMMLAVASTVCEKPIQLKDSECVKKSYPDFWEVFKEVGGEINERSMG
ncbi:3-phosphoshikimate 1-carboxyvinyltransferase [Marinilactibacillus sp. Marseille-P9653]|uniref:3-phosphoshikimate 1-carboxyvinyltransferase n=1 Tax=Marinilactibacillus sp. Marseille-P9653 TaxID=2866583 RepID=UPI001CE41F20|nr:3-phosphoshikimate 1-carboxyvinyltransferase [Marinilactibacillus sp. Marseille-P9653]